MRITRRERLEVIGKYYGGFWEPDSLELIHMVHPPPQKKGQAERKTVTV